MGSLLIIYLFIFIHSLAEYSIIIFSLLFIYQLQMQEVGHFFLNRLFLSAKIVEMHILCCVSWIINTEVNIVWPWTSYFYHHSQIFWMSVWKMVATNRIAWLWILQWLFKKKFSQTFCLCAGWINRYSKPKSCHCLSECCYIYTFREINIQMAYYSCVCILSCDRKKSK